MGSLLLLYRAPRCCCSWSLLLLLLPHQNVPYQYNPCICCHCFSSAAATTNAGSCSDSCPVAATLPQAATTALLALLVLLRLPLQWLLRPAACCCCPRPGATRQVLASHQPTQPAQHGQLHKRDSVQVIFERRARAKLIGLHKTTGSHSLTVHYSIAVVHCSRPIRPITAYTGQHSAQHSMHSPTYLDLCCVECLMFH